MDPEPTPAAAPEPAPDVAATLEPSPELATTPEPTSEPSPEPAAETPIDDAPTPLTSEEADAEAGAAVAAPAPATAAPTPPVAPRPSRSIDPRLGRTIHRPEGLPPIEFPRAYYADDEPRPPQAGLIDPDSAPRVSIARRLARRVQSWTPPWNRED
jgi:hypothetical protein